MAETYEDVGKRVAEKKETVRKLKMVKLHRTKHDVSELENLIQQWRGVCQAALQDLVGKLKEQSSDPDQVSIGKLLQHLGIEPELVEYSPEEECFLNT